MDDNHSTENSVSDLIRGLIYTHNRANTNTTEVHQVAATLQALVELLVKQGMVNREELEVLWPKYLEMKTTSVGIRGG